MNYLQILNNSPVLYENDKVIAGTGTNLKVNLSELSDEVKQSIGWVDVEVLAESSANLQDWGIDSHEGNGYYDYVDGFVNGFLAAQSINESMFTDDDLKKAVEYARLWKFGRDEHEYTTVEFNKTEQEIIQALSAPKLFECEIETDRLLVNDKGKPIYPDKPGEWITSPRIENNSIKVLKIKI